MKQVENLQRVVKEMVDLTSCEDNNNRNLLHDESIVNYVIIRKCLSSRWLWQNTLLLWVNIVFPFTTATIRSRKLKKNQRFPLKKLSLMLLLENL